VISNPEFSPKWLLQNKFYKHYMNDFNIKVDIHILIKDSFLSLELLLKYINTVMNRRPLINCST